MSPNAIRSSPGPRKRGIDFASDPVQGASATTCRNATNGVAISSQRQLNEIKSQRQYYCRWM